MRGLLVPQEKDLQLPRSLRGMSSLPQQPSSVPVLGPLDRQVVTAGAPAGGNGPNDNSQAFGHGELPEIPTSKQAFQAVAGGREASVSEAPLPPLLGLTALAGPSSTLPTPPLSQSNSQVILYDMASIQPIM